MLKKKIPFSPRAAGAMLLGTLFFAAIPGLRAKPKSPRDQLPKPPATKAANPLRGERLPIPVYNWEGDPRNEDWRDIARLLRVRDLRVYQWPSAYNRAGGAKAQQKQTLQQLQAAGYTVEEFDWQLRSWQKTTGFEAQRGGEKLSAMWGNNGSYLFLYWGHQEAETPLQKRDDALIAAVLAGESKKVGDLLEQGADPRAVDYSGVSVLTWAAERSDAEIVTQILNARKARPKNASDTDFETAFQTALRREDTALLQAFLDGGAKPQQIGAALRVAAASGATKAAKLLLPGAPGGDVDAALITASFVEIWRGSPIQYPEIVQLCLTRKPSQSALDTAMLRAAEDDEANVVLILLQAGADVKARDEQGRTALMRVAADYRDTRSLRALLDAGADPNARDNAGSSALTRADSNFASIYIEMIDLLLARGADPNARSAKGAVDGNVVVKQLQQWLEKPKGVTAKDKTQLVTLIEAVKKRMAEQPIP